MTCYEGRMIMLEKPDETNRQQPPEPREYSHDHYERLLAIARSVERLLKDTREIRQGEIIIREEDDTEECC
ncbi:MAG: hypothetical protein D6820_18430 [Lentisphaerae bacterium]|nr:MAG: hypothetical protein D6820_18430 [Lentisphaerota bacterium]